MRERGPKIGKSLEGDIAIPEFEVKNSETETQYNKETRKGIYGDIGRRRLMRKILMAFRKEIPENLLDLINKMSRGEALEPEEQSQFNSAATQWFKDKFGADFAKYNRKRVAAEILTRGTKPGTAKEKEIEAREGEGDQTIEDQKPERTERDAEKGWWDIVVEAKLEFSEEIQDLINRKLSGERLPPKSQSAFDRALEKWWKERFGVSFSNRHLTPEQEREQEEKRNKEKADRKLERSDKKIKRLKEKYGEKKIERMSELKKAIKNLDKGEIVKEFGEESRRVVYFDEETGENYMEENGSRKSIGIGDIVSDYAWGIKYVPDGEMIEPAYRQLAKRILVNETRRDLEGIYDRELASSETGASTAFPELSKFEKNQAGTLGLMAEVVVRELFNRLSLNNDLDFIVMRANSFEDGVYKYDFKIRAKNRNRGVKLEEGESVKGTLYKLGIQLKTHLDKKGSGLSINLRKYKKGVAKIVDEVLVLEITTKEFKEVFSHWLDAGKPSGGPEQFLSRDLKAQILKEVTKGLIKITDEEIEKALPPEPETRVETQEAA